MSNENANSATVFLNVATAQPTAAPYVNDELSGGAIFGIVLGITLGFILLMVGVWGLIGLASKRAAYPPNDLPMESLPPSSPPSSSAPSAPPAATTDFD